MTTPVAIVIGWAILILLALLFGRMYAKWRGVR